MLFTSEENLNTFKANPKAYAPQFGGYCAFAVSNGFTADCEPEFYALKDGKLFLFSAEETKKDFFSNTDFAQKAFNNWK